MCNYNKVSDKNFGACRTGDHQNGRKEHGNNTESLRKCENYEIMIVHDGSKDKVGNKDINMDGIADECKLNLKEGTCKKTNDKHTRWEELLNVFKYNFNSYI